MKKFVCVLIAFLLLVPFGNSFAGDDDLIKVIINDASQIYDVSPIIRNNRVLVPMRAIFEALGCTVEYVESEEAKSVFARKGSKTIHLDIGSNTMDINYEDSVTLDSPAIIYNNRTLVPIRAVSEALKAQVEWDASTKSVIIKEYGDHKIKTVVLEKNYEKGGVTLIRAKASYPVIDNPEDDSFISSLNDKFVKDAEEFVSYAESDYLDAAEVECKYKSDNGIDFYPYECTSDFDIECDKNGKLCLVFNGYYYTGGAHPFSSKDSYVYDLENKKQLELSDFIKVEGEEKNKLICESFEQFINEVSDYAELTPDDEVFVTMRDEIKNEADKVKFYITDDALVLYFDVYQVAAYVFGYPTANIEFNENKKIFK